MEMCGIVQYLLIPLEVYNLNFWLTTADMFSVNYRETTNKTNSTTQVSIGRNNREYKQQTYACLSDSSHCLEEAYNITKLSQKLTTTEKNIIPV